MKLTLLSIFALSLGQLAYSQCNPSGLYFFNGNANDASGNGLNGTVIGATLTTNRFGDPNSAFYFDGVNDHIIIADDTSNDLFNTFTIMAWIKPDQGFGNFRDNHVSIVEKWGNAGSQLAAFGMNIHTNGELEGFTHTGTAGTYKWSNTTIQPDVWTHVVMTRSDDDSVRLYINGVLDRTYFSVMPQNSMFDLTFGTAADSAIRKAFPTAYRYSGVIDDVKIYKCALVPSQFSLSTKDLSFTSNKLFIYPNPSTGVFHLEFGSSVSYKVQAYSATGQLLYNEINAKDIDLSNLASGVVNFIVTDLSTGYTITRKVVIQ